MNPKLKYLAIFLVLAIVVAVVVYFIVSKGSKKSNPIETLKDEETPAAGASNSSAGSSSTGIQTSTPINQANRDTVKAIQNYINTLRIGTTSPIAVDGIWGNQSRTAGQAAFGQDVSAMTYTQIQALRANAPTSTTLGGTLGTSATPAAASSSVSVAAQSFAKNFHEDLGSYTSSYPLYEDFSNAPDTTIRQTVAYWNDKYKHLHGGKTLYQAIDPSIYWIGSMKSIARTVRAKLDALGLS